ncbi:RNA-directed DNA polymerase, eukaryota, reverse transcriptase zinc-binding domain protein [Tanacetum coccineum]
MNFLSLNIQGLAQKAKQDWVKKLCISNKVNFLSLQETKLENIDLWCIQRCWGNFNFDYVYSEAVGQSGGILSVWDPNKFQKLNHTISDYCTLVRGVWVPNGRKLLIISIYAPQELSEKRTLWDYLCFTICNWNGDVVTMGDFNEVRDSSERFGSVFNKHGAKLFNDFIAKAGLTEVPLGGCIFTWCHKTASKMSKLDRFLIDGFDKLVEDSWNKIHVVDNNAYVRFMKKLKLLKERIKAWNSSYRELKNCRKNTLKTELTNLDSVLDRGEGIDTDVTRRFDVVRILQDIEKLKLWKWPRKPKSNGPWRETRTLKSPQLVKNEFYTHFKQRFKKPNLSGIQFDRELPNKICSEQAVDLEREVSKEEVKRAVWDCGADKAPGPDGFTFGFYRRFWNLIECDIVNAVKWFFLHERIPSGGNLSFITLIPKVSNANMVKDFRPISLIGSVYKIVAKILANRLVLVLGDLVSDTQSAFLKERQILDGPFILNEVIQWCKKKKKQSMIFKVDFEKAYDSVRWDFVDTILKKFGFGDKWCKWIHSCLQSSRVMESLHLSFQRVVDAGLFSGIKLDSSMSVSHLFYADDAIFMGQWNQSNIDTIVRVLKVFHSASGLRINMKKSKLMGIVVDASRVEHAVRQIGCMALKMPFKYLGSVVGDRMSRVKAWNDVIDTLVTRLSRWKLKTISIGGRLTLLKSVLGSTPIFHMSIYKVPMAVLRTMEGIRARFFNGADNKVRKSSWVSWNQVMASKDAGGLGVASLFALNRGLLFKWVWRFITQKNSLWAKVITAIHGDDGKIGKTVKPTFPSIWLNIIQEVAVMKLKGIDVVSFIKPKCGDGTNISFWNDAWRGDVAFKILAPRIYMLESMKDIQVATKLSHVDLEWSFRRKSRGGAELKSITILKEILEGCILSDTKDTWTWSLEGSGEFSVSSIRKTIDAAFLPCGNVKTRWVKEVPIKINILAWKVSNDYLPTRFNLSRRGMDIGSIVCPMCNSMVESSRHLFFSCDLSNQIMSKISRWWDLGYQEINSYEEWTDWMLSIRLPYNLKKVFEGVCYIVWWFIWDWRNQAIFGPGFRAKSMMFDDIVSRSRDDIIIHEMFNGGVDMVSLYMRWSRDGIVVHEMFNGGVETLSLYMRCSTEESRRLGKTSLDVIFLWKDERVRLLVASLGVSTSLISSAVPSTPPSDSPRPSRNAECSNCKLLLGKIKVLEATTEMYMHPEQHTLNLTALLHEVYNDMGKLGLEYFVIWNVIREMVNDMSLMRRARIHHANG